MKVFLVGATGRTGKWLLKAALARRHEVTALVRKPADRIALTDSRLRIVEGDLTAITKFADLLHGHDAIVSSLSSQAVDIGTKILIDGAQAAAVARFIGIAGGGVLQMDEQHLRRDRVGYPEKFRQSSALHLEAWKALEASLLQWTLFCTPDLIDSAATGQVKLRADYMPEGGNRVACGDVAESIIDELEAPKFINRRVGCTM